MADEGPKEHAVSITQAPAEVWFLTGSQGLYGPEVVEQVVAQSRRIAETLDGSPDLPVRVVWKPVLTDADAIRRQCLAANTDDACVGVIAWMHTFSPAKAWIGGLTALRTPLLFDPGTMTVASGGRASGATLNTSVIRVRAPPVGSRVRRAHRGSAPPGPQAREGSGRLGRLRSSVRSRGWRCSRPARWPGW